MTKLGFDWYAVAWGQPDSPASALCSYCSMVIDDEDGAHVTLWNDDRCAIFCSVCSGKWFDMAAFKAAAKPEG